MTDVRQAVVFYPWGQGIRAIPHFYQGRTLDEYILDQTSDGKKFTDLTRCYWLQTKPFTKIYRQVIFKLYDLLSLEIFCKKGESTNHNKRSVH